MLKLQDYLKLAFRKISKYHHAKVKKKLNIFYNQFN